MYPCTFITKWIRYCACTNLNFSQHNTTLITTHSMEAPLTLLAQWRA